MTMKALAFAQLAMYDLGDMMKIFSELMKTGGFLDRYDRQFSLIHAERTTRQIQIFMNDLNSKLVADFYENAAKELPIY